MARTGIERLAICELAVIIGDDDILRGRVRAGTGAQHFILQPGGRRMDSGTLRV